MRACTAGEKVLKDRKYILQEKSYRRRERERKRVPVEEALQEKGHLRRKVTASERHLTAGAASQPRAIRSKAFQELGAAAFLL